MYHADGLDVQMHVQWGRWFESCNVHIHALSVQPVVKIKTVLHFRSNEEQIGEAHVKHIQ